MVELQRAWASRHHSVPNELPVSEVATSSAGGKSRGRWTGHEGWAISTELRESTELMEVWQWAELTLQILQIFSPHSVYFPASTDSKLTIPRGGSSSPLLWLLSTKSRSDSLDQCHAPGRRMWHHQRSPMQQCGYLLLHLFGEGWHQLAEYRTVGASTMLVWVRPCSVSSCWLNRLISNLCASPQARLACRAASSLFQCALRCHLGLKWPWYKVIPVRGLAIVYCSTGLQ